METEIDAAAPEGSDFAAPLRVAMIAPPWFCVPPAGYGGIERVVALLADGLADAGAQVTLFAPEESRTRADLEVTFARPQYEVIGHSAVATENTIRAYRRWRDFDVIHDHTVEGLAAAALVGVPVVHTVHGPLLDEYRSLYQVLPRNVHLVAISEYQRRAIPAAISSSVIWNATPTENVAWSVEPGAYLLFVGRASPDKGLVEAAEIARRANMPLRVYLKVNEAPEQRHFEEVRPLLEAARAEVRIGASESEKQEAYQGARALLFPIRWPEPFGLVMIEAMAAGTPVIAFRQGSVPEVVEQGVTGFICDDIDGAVAAVKQVHTLDRAASRSRVERLFSPAAAIERHLEVYRTIVRGRQESEW